MHIMLDRYLRGAGTKCFANLLNVYFIFDFAGMLDTLQLLARHSKIDSHRAQVQGIGALDR